MYTPTQLIFPLRKHFSQLIDTDIQICFITVSCFANSTCSCQYFRLKSIRVYYLVRGVIYGSYAKYRCAPGININIYTFAFGTRC